MNTPSPLVAIIGAGSIGVAFAIVFARAGWRVRLQDPDTRRLQLAHEEINSRCVELQHYGLLQETPETLNARVELCSDLASAVAGARLIQECAPERLELKIELFRQFDCLAPHDAILASSSSALTASSFADTLPGRSRCLVAHPGNPPYLLPVIEIVPAPFTDPQHVERAMALYTEAGLSPVRLNKEIEGFVFNRLQGALLREAYCLVRDGVSSVADIDKVVSQGLGLRWTFMGPFETVDLNTRGGIGSHALKMGPAYARMGAERGQHDPWTHDLVAKVEAQRRALVPLQDWEQRVAWRDRALMERARDELKRQLK
ncbi:3-hydroxyacyl-CoA dehydrogenase [Pseudomonas sp. CCC3.1]|uniref:3-hydroxyacyl-CoA dehydrogenase n=1 Tax=Pseudomonas sp. CCC3.1 TaxID=3048607 RepID=UPI002AC8D6F6|nr:3-hydroxyacyl-CoA dehydrogenase [Pseudomonas sp. CCC3.1]MEB0205186.1 3-hydroxyacyl-CoA dehydrogenase [Pseudomonas sp. CCC3.1]WPX38423.1 3-hydroxyacyl-CoA dehydrogenase [Pseudomonas sp. CCC3.1]